MVEKAKEVKSTDQLNDIKEILTVVCEKYPNRTAFLEKGNHKDAYKEITYGRLKLDTISLGTAFLEKLNLKGEKIAVLGENSYRWAITYMATVCGLGTIVPIDKELPVNEIENLLTRSGAKAIIYSNKRSENVEKLIGKIPNVKYYINMNIEEDTENVLSFDKLLEEGRKILKEGNTKYEKLKVDRDVMNMLLFTSGTTQKSKGVMLSHKNICSTINSGLKLIKVNKDDRFFSILPIHHVYECTNGLLLPLSLGASIAYGEGLKTIVSNMQETNPTVMLMVPVLLETMYNRVMSGIKKKGKESTVKIMVFLTNLLGASGIPLKKKIFKEIHETLGGKLRLAVVGAAALDPHVAEGMKGFGFSVYQGYGLTETSPLVSISPETCIKYKSVGIPIACTEVRIDKPNDQGIGEIIVKGDNVMIGYYEADELTKEVIKDGWFYTGDMGYLDKDGYIYITGRLKSVIVTQNGKNIFPEELESLLNRYDIIKESLVYGMQDPKDSKETIVAAKVVLNSDYIASKYGDNVPSKEELELEIKSIIKDVNSKLVMYKYIRHFEIRDKEFEKTTTMKIKRFAN